MFKSVRVKGVGGLAAREGGSSQRTPRRPVRGEGREPGWVGVNLYI